MILFMRVCLAHPHFFFSLPRIFKLKALLLHTALLLLLYIQLPAQDLDNPFILENEWSNYAIGDPYVLKHRGVFYLYCSTKDHETGIKCWSSKDLLNWKYEGLCATDPVTTGAYAPEVVYWDGGFYMYTSPAGNGHYVLSASSPTGPFEVISPNLGKSIDGSVFIDDNGRWYFYHASGQGINGCEMTDPVTIGSSIPNVSMLNRWTEGPCVFKRNGTYYMIYTGNHVISKGYRIDYASNYTGPIDQFSPAEQQNPILLDALGTHVGLGHGSVFIGPDLDSYYLTYHNLRSGNGPFRRLNFDRIAWNGEKMLLLGPTTFPQQNPDLPEAYDYFERDAAGDAWSYPSGGAWHIKEWGILSQDSVSADPEVSFKALLDSTSANDFTAEFNLQETHRDRDDAVFGALFGYQDEENYGLALLNSQTNNLEINMIINNVWGTPDVTTLPVQLDFSQWHTLKIEKFKRQYKFFVDGLFADSLSSDLEGGKIGYLSSGCQADFGFLAFSNKSNGSGTYNVFKPIPGKLPAVQYITGGEGIAYHKGDPAGKNEQLIRSDEVELLESSHGGYGLAHLASGDWFKYNINVEQDSYYNIELHYATAATGCQIRFYSGENPLTDPLDIPSTGGEGTWKKFLIKNIRFDAGYQTLKVEVAGGSIHLYQMEIVKANNSTFDHVFTFDEGYGPGWTYGDGNWLIDDKNAVIDGYGKRTFGSEFWRDYTVETDISFTRSMNAGILLRTNNPALGGAGNSPSLGTDFLQGYFVGFNFGAVILGKHNYNWERLAIVSASVVPETWYHIRALIEGDRIRVYLEDMQDPIIDYTDPDPLINGMAGLRSYNTGVRYNNFRITSSLLTSSREESRDPVQGSEVLIYPNPASDQVTIWFGSSGKREVRISDLKGAEIICLETTENRLSIPVRRMEPGMYTVQVIHKDRATTKKLIIGSIHK